MAESQEIKAKLVLDDAASKTVEHVKAGFEKLDHVVEETTHTIGSFVKSAATMALGFQFDRGIESLKEWGKEAMEAAKAAGESDKEIAGMLAAQDQSGKSFDMLKKDAREYREKLEEMGVQAGVSSKATVDAFTDIAARSNKPTEEVVKMTEQMMYAGKIVPGGLGSITDGYRMMEMGMIRAKNPLVMLIAQSHLMSGSAKQVAKDLQKMAPEEAMKMADQAIAKMAEKGKAMPLKGGAMIQSIKDMAEQSMVGAGEALLKALSKPYALIREIFMENRGALSDLYKSAGEGLGTAITYGVEKAKEGINYIRTHSDEIKKGITEAWGYAKKVFEFMVSHASELGTALKMGLAAKAGGMAAGAVASAAPLVSGAAALAGSAGGAVAALFGLSSATDGAAKTSFTASAAFTKLRGTLNDNVSAATATQVAFAALFLAYDQFAKLTKENSFLILSIGTAIGAAFGKGKYRTAEELANEAAKLDALKAQNAAESSAIYSKAFHKEADQGAAEYAIDPSGGHGTQVMLEAFNQAQALNDAGSEKYAATLILNSGLTAEYLKNAGFKLAGGLDEFIRVIGESADPDKLKNFLGTKALKGAAPQVNFNGGQKFEIKQDFRNEDPDRIALIFRRDILKAAEHRRVSKMGGTFGT